VTCLQLDLMIVFLMRIIFLAFGRDNKFIDDGWEIVWHDKTILSFDPHTKEIEFQV
jgi:hypothetical protein